MKCLVINLDKNTERLERIDKRLKELGVEYERVKGVYGRELSSVEKKIAVNRFRWWCSMGTPIGDGQIGCCLSHLKCAEYAAENNEAVCILEDDATICEEFPKVLARIGSVLDYSRPQVVLLGDHTGHARELLFGLHRIYQASFAEGYVITPMAGERLFKANSPIRAMNDLWGYWVKKNVVELYQVSPHVTEQHWQEVGYISDVCPKGKLRVDVRVMNKFEFLCFKSKRLVGKAIDFFLP